MPVVLASPASGIEPPAAFFPATQRTSRVGADEVIK